VTGMDGYFSIKRVGRAAARGEGPRPAAPAQTRGGGHAHLSSSLLSLVFLRVAMGPQVLRGDGGMACRAPGPTPAGPSPDPCTARSL